jgi:predicted RecB family nuclease
LEVPDSTGDIIALSDGEDFAINILKKSPVSLNAFREGEYLHVSDVLGKCMRKIALAERFSVPMPRGFIHESLALTFAQGTAIHDYIKQRVAKGHPDKMFGEWSCRCGNLKTEPAVLSKVEKKVCKLCAGHPVQYHELELRDDDLKLVGSPDITLYLPDTGVYYPIEIKSMAHNEWTELTRPKPDHVIQVLFYWYLLRKLGYPVPNQISILYATKGFLFKTPYKEFLVFPEKVVSRLDDYIAEARSLREAKSSGAIPVRTQCTAPTDRDAKECHVCNLCFQHD